MEICTFLFPPCFSYWVPGADLVPFPVFSFLFRSYATIVVL
nr:MAG TPA: hypothetical protein [Caudoviricetes sp.]